MTLPTTSGGRRRAARRAPKSGGAQSSSRGATLAADLARSHRRFLSYLRALTRNREEAEDLLQAAYERVLRSTATPAPGTDSVTWFLRVLRNAFVDRARQRAGDARTRDRLAREARTFTLGPEFEAAVCRCVNAALGTLPAPMAAVLRAVDLEDRAVSDFARASGISVANAHVRIHRARALLRKNVGRVCGACSSHGCLDCDCC